MTAHWTEQARGSAHQTLQPYLQELKANYRDARLSWWEVFLGFYTDQSEVAVLSSRASGPSSPLFAQKAVPLNVIRPIVDTAEAKIAGSTRPRPFFKAVGANYSKKRKCQRLQKFIDGVIDETKAYRVGAQMVRDAGIFGTAACKVFVRGGKICVERVLVSEILVDENLAFDCAPNELTHVKEVSKSMLSDMFPNKRDAIDALVSCSAHTTQWSDTVEVYETWSLPRGKKPGRHVITIPGATLLDEPYKHDYFPIVFFRWSEAPTGFFGMGLAHQLMGIQQEMSRGYRAISTNLHLFANPRVLNFEGSNLSPHHLTNAWGTILSCRKGFEPQLWTTQVMPPEAYQWLENQYQKAFEIAGFSTQSAFAKKPAGVESGKAFRELSDIQADRLAPVSIRYENLYIDLAQRFIDCAEQLFEEDPEFSTIWQSSKSAERLKWSDVRLDKNDYTLQLFATSFLSRTPSAAFDDVKDLMSAELVDANEARSLLNFPDLQRIFDLQTAARDNFERIIELILDKGLYLAPQPFDDLELGKKVFVEAYSRARTEEVAEDRLQMLRKYIEETQALLDEVAAQQAPPAPAAPMMTPDQQTQGMPA